MSARSPTTPPGFPAGLDKQFHLLWDQVAKVHAMWRLYLDLFGTAESMRVVQDTAPGAFQLFDIALRHYMVMGFGRLTDPPQTGNKANLTMERLLNALRGHWPDERQQEAEALLQEIRKAGSTLKELRNREVGHSDFQTALATHREPIPPVRAHEIDRVFDLIADLLNMVSGHFLRSSSPFQHPLIEGTGADLIHLLARVLRQAEAERRRLLGGQ
jgi:hypothetical protein